MRAKIVICREGSIPPRRRGIPWWHCLLALCMVLCACNDTTEQKTTISSSTTQSITYSTRSNDVVIRTFTAGGLYGTFETSPQVSIYGNGTFILGTQQTGRLNTDELQQLLSTLVDSYGLLTLKRQQFTESPDQNATYLELTVNGKRHEMVSGIFGNEPESQQDMAEYRQLRAALTFLNNALQGPLHPYTGVETAILVHQTFSYDATQNISSWQLPDFTLNQVATIECGSLPADFDPNKETNCLKYTLPQHVHLLSRQEAISIKNQLQGQNQGTFQEGNYYYSVILRTLLPDEVSSKSLAMFGSAQDTYQGVPLQQGAIPSSTP